MQFIFNFRLFSYIRVHFLGQNLEWSGFTHVVLISQLKVFLKNNLVMTVIKRVFYDLFGSVTTSSWLFYTSWQVKILFYCDNDNRWFQRLPQLPHFPLLSVLLSPRLMDGSNLQSDNKSWVRKCTKCNTSNNSTWTRQWAIKSKKL